MSYVIGLRCRECHKQYPQKGVHVCEVCFGPLEVEYDYAAMKGKVTRASIEAKDRGICGGIGICCQSMANRKTGHHSGWTPFKRAHNLGKLLGVKELYIKDDSANYPTWSYKERVVSVAITKAIELGYDTVGVRQHREPGEFRRRPRGAGGAESLRDDSARSRAGQGAGVADFWADDGAHSGQL